MDAAAAGSAPGSDRAPGSEAGRRAPPPTHRNEPWRRYVELLISRLPLDRTSSIAAQLRESAGAYKFSAELLADLDILSESLNETGANRLATADVAPVRRAIEVFGFHLAQLDIRQNSTVHSKALTQLLGASGLSGDDWEDWTEPERCGSSNGSSVLRALFSTRAIPRGKRLIPYSPAIACSRNISNASAPMESVRSS